MDFELSKRQKQIQLAAREFAESELMEIGKECEIKEDLPRDMTKKASGLGFIGVFIEKDFGSIQRIY